MLGYHDLVVENLYNDLDRDCEMNKFITKAKFKDLMKKREMRKLETLSENILFTNGINEVYDVKRLGNDKIWSMI